MLRLQLLVAGFRRGKRVVAVADGEDHRHALQADVFFAHGLGVVRQHAVELVNIRALDEPAGDMAAVFHQVEVIELLELVLFRADRLDQLLFVVVAEHEDVRQLDGRVAAHALTRRDALGDGALGGADRRGRAGGIVIGIEVDHADQTLAHGAVFERALDIDQTVLIGREDVILHVPRHGLVDDAGMLRLFFGAKLGLRQDQVDRGNRALGIFPHSVPIGLIRRELVAGNDRPLFHAVGLGHEDIRR